MVLITLEPRALDCRVELDGIDISRRLRRIEIDADAHGGLTLIRLTLIDCAIVVGEAGRIEFVKNPRE